MPIAASRASKAAPNAESISIGITDTPADIEVSFTSTETNEIKFDDRDAGDNSYITEDITIPSLKVWAISILV